VSENIQEQTTSSPCSHDMEEDSVRTRDQTNVPPTDSQTTFKKFNVANFDPRDNIGSEARGPVSSRTRRKAARAIGDVGSRSGEADVDAAEVSADDHRCGESVSGGIGVS